MSNYYKMRQEFMFWLEDEIQEEKRLEVLYFKAARKYGFSSKAVDAAIKILVDAKMAYVDDLGYVKTMRTK